MTEEIIDFSKVRILTFPLFDEQACQREEEEKDEPLIIVNKDDFKVRKSKCTGPLYVLKGDNMVILGGDQ